MLNTVNSKYIAVRDQAWGFPAHWLLATILSVPLVATLFWWFGTRYFNSGLSFFEYQQFSVIVTGVVAGGYQLYFWVQRNNYHLEARCPKIPLDDWIPFSPGWIWPYSFLYFVIIGMTAITVHDLADGVRLIFGGIMVLVAGSTIFYFFPTYVPESFRDFEIKSLSTRYLAFIQSMDNSRNALPSMHCAISTYVGLVVVDLPTIGPLIGYGYISVIAISCLLTKQHLVLDTLAGVLLGAGIFHANEWLSGIV